MLNILIVDDNVNKVDAIKEVVDTCAMMDEYSVDVAPNAHFAYDNLKTTLYDILILDVNIPLRADDEPRKDGGIGLLKKINRDSTIKRPKCIIGLTEYEDIISQYSHEFTCGLWYLIKYDNTSNDWRKLLSERINYICPSKTDTPRVKVLFLAADPSTQREERLYLDKEAREIQEKIRQSAYRDSLDFQTRWAVRVDDVILALNEINPDVVHFSGHGSKKGEIILVDSTGKANPIKLDGLKKLFETMKGNIRVVFLNACYSEIQAKAISEHIECCIGMNNSVEDDTAIEFSAIFYRAIGFGKTIKNAFDQGVVSLTLNNMPDKTCPVLICKDNCNPDEVVLLREKV